MNTLNPGDLVEHKTAQISMAVAAVHHVPACTPNWFARLFGERPREASTYYRCTWFDVHDKNPRSHTFNGHELVPLVGIVKYDPQNF